MRVVRGIHQDVLAQELDDGLRQLDAFRHLDGLEEAPRGDVVGRALLQRRQRAGDGLRVLVEALGPERQPPVAGLEDTESKIRIAVEHAGADDGRHVAHPAPGMRRRALQP